MLSAIYNAILYYLLGGGGGGRGYRKKVLAEDRRKFVVGVERKVTGNLTGNLVVKIMVGWLRQRSSTVEKSSSVGGGSGQKLLSAAHSEAAVNSAPYSGAILSFVSGKYLCVWLRAFSMRKNRRTFSEKLTQFLAKYLRS
jgi:hypothetical protein